MTFFWTNLLGEVVVVGVRRGFPRASHPLKLSGICHKVLELHGMAAMVSHSCVTSHKLLHSSNGYKFVP